MHELAVCQELVAAILSEMRRPDFAGAHLRSVRVRVGVLRQIEHESLRFAYEVLTQDTPAAGSALEIVTAPVSVRCRVCGWSGEIHDRIFACPACGAGDVEVTGGGEVILESLELECNGPDDH